MPAFKGGREEMMRIVKNKLKWSSGHCDIQGTVFVSFIIESSGQLTSKRIVKGLNGAEGCDANKEALRVVDFLTSWTPGQCGGKNVATLFIIPVKFNLTD
jgi:protein TonB